MLIWRCSAMRNIVAAPAINDELFSNVSVEIRFSSDNHLNDTSEHHPVT
jgi:hypothetical protein